MATVLEQKERLISLSTPLGTDVLVLQSFQGQEELSRLFHYHLEMVSENTGIAPADIVGKNVTFTITQADGEKRYFNGFVQRLTGGSLHSRSLRRYQAEVVPWLWFLTRTQDCRIFQNKSVPQIIEQVFQDMGFDDYQLQLRGEHPERIYCVQYRESAFNFVSRLMEDEGIFYWFSHEDGKHTLMMADHTGAYEDCAENEIDFVAGSLDNDHFSVWEHKYEFRSGKYAQCDYNFETPSTSLLTSTDTLVSLPSVDKYELYDYWGEYKHKGDGEVLTKLRMEREEVPYDVVSAESNCRTLRPAGTFSISRHECPSEEGVGYVITSLQHQAVDHTQLSGDAGPSEYHNSITCIPDSIVFRPDRITPKPEIKGPQTAKVVGPAGEEIYPDNYGRVKVQFHWDRYGGNDENSSCWMRVAHNWAGKNWGAVAIPRIGQEVIVDFLEGDINAPIITGRVYNAEQMPPYELPANKTQTGIKTRSSSGGSGDNFNEIRFEDKKGSEQVYIHAEKNQDNVVENDETTSVGHDRTETVGNDETITIGNDRTESVGNNETISIGNDRTETVGNNETITIGTDRKETVGSNETIGIGSDRTETVGANETITIALMRTRNVGINDMINVGAAQEITVGAAQAITVGAAQAITVGANQDMTIGANQGINVGANLSESVGKNQSDTVGDNRTASVGKDDSLKVGKNLTIDAGDQVLIKTGKASILMKKDGTINIEGKDITIKGSGDITVKASKNITMKGTKILEN